MEKGLRIEMTATNNKKFQCHLYSVELSNKMESTILFLYTLLILITNHGRIEGITR
jgi:hypothetical protein